MGAALLRISKLQDKWRLKLAKAMEARDASDTLIKTKFMRRRIVQGKIKHWCEKYSMFLLPFITVLREGLEAVIFIGGVGLSVPATAFPLAVVCGLACGIAIGYLIYRLVLRFLRSCHDTKLDLQRWQRCTPAILPHRLDMFPLPRGCRTLLKGSLGTRDQLLEQDCWRRCCRSRLRPRFLRHSQECLACQRKSSSFQPTILASNTSPRSAATPRSTEAAAGVSSTPSSAGRTPPQSAPSSPTTSTG